MDTCRERSSRYKKKEDGKFVMMDKRPLHKNTNNNQFSLSPSFDSERDTFVSVVLVDAEVLSLKPTFMISFSTFVCSC